MVVESCHVANIKKKKVHWKLVDGSCRKEIVRGWPTMVAKKIIDKI